MKKNASDLVMPSQETTGGTDTLITVERTMRIIALLADAEHGLSVSEISRQLEVNKNLAFRILSSLQALRFVQQDRDSFHYRLTYKISNLGLRQLATSHFSEQCFPILRGLAEKTGEHVRLAVVEENGPIWVHAETGKQWRLMIDPVYTHQLSYHAHATGKVWLATLPEAQVRKLVGKPPLTAHTRFTITTLKALLDDLRHCSERGYALSYEEAEIGVGTVAAPVMSRNAMGDAVCVGMVSLAAPTSRLDRAQLLGCAPDVLSTAAHLADVWPLRLDPVSGHSTAASGPG